MDRRAIFFLGAAVVCGVLSFALDADLRWVGITLAVAYLVFALLSWLDWHSRRRD